MNLTAAHLHLLLNHVPTVAFGVGIALFAGALLTDSRDLKRASLVLLAGVALLMLPTYITGNAAEAQLRSTPGVSATMVQAHEGAALLTFVFMQIAGAAAWAALWQMRRRPQESRGTLLAVLLLSAVTLGLAARTAALGGEIRHPEIRATSEGTTFDASLASRIGSFVNDTPWVWPTAETLHFVGLSLLMGVVLLFNLRVLGLMKHLATAALDRMLPWAIVGFAVNLVTGMLFFVAKADQYTGNIAFSWKVWLVVIAGANALYFTAFDGVWSLAPGAAASRTSQAVAASAICLWIGVLYFGSMLPFIGNAF